MGGSSKRETEFDFKGEKYQKIPDNRGRKMTVAGYLRF